MRALLFVAAILFASVCCAAAYEDICTEAEPSCPAEAPPPTGFPWKEFDNCYLKRKGCMVNTRSGDVTQYAVAKDLLKNSPALKDVKQQNLDPSMGIVYERKVLGKWEQIIVRKPLEVYHGGDLQLDKTKGILYGSLFTGPLTVAKEYALSRGMKNVFAVTIPINSRILPINTHNLKIILQGGLFEKEADHVALTKEYDSYFFKYANTASLLNQEDREYVNDYYDCRTKPADKPLCSRSSDTVKDREFLEILCKQIPEIDGVAGWTAPKWQEIMLCNKEKNGKRVVVPRPIPI